MSEKKEFFFPINSRVGRYVIKSACWRSSNHPRSRPWMVKVRFAGQTKVIRASVIIQEKYSRSSKVTLKKAYPRLYAIWKQARARCYTPWRKDYKWYGQKGIFMANEWLNDFDSFALFALRNGYAPGLVCDRINSDGPYAPDNVRWITRAANTRKAVIERERNRKLLAQSA